jgi:carbonic anhydrase/acetyltransferase-like protein (isoleucine patch superfamily)
MLKTVMGKTPKIGNNVFLAENCALIGDARIKDSASIWYNTVLRADINYIEIGEKVNIQDGCVLHVEKSLPVIIEEGTTVGHGAIIHAAHIEPYCLIGMGAIVLDGAVIGKESIIAAGALITPGTIIPPHSMVMGSPGKVKRQLTAEEITHLHTSCENYVKYSQSFMDEM